MLDACAEQTVGFDFGLHVAVEAAIPLAAEEPQDVLGGEGHGRKLQELLIQPGQGGRTREQEVGGELGLIDDPADPVAGEFLAQERIDQVAIAAEDLGPIEAWRNGRPGVGPWRDRRVAVKALCFCTKPIPRRANWGAVPILDTPKSNKMYANYIDRFVMAAAFDEGVGEADGRDFVGLGVGGDPRASAHK